MTAFLKITAAEYHADPAPAPSLSSSLVKVLLTESPRKAWYSHPKLNPAYREEHDDKFDIGTCAHAMLLENDPSRIVIVQADDWRTKVAKEARQAARDAGKTALLERHFDKVKVMVDAAQEFLKDCEIADEWTQGESEASAVHKDGGIYLRVRFDRVSPGCIMDYKTTDGAEPEAFSRRLISLGYHWQESFYRRVHRAITGNAVPFVFLAQSTEPPHECSLHGCEPTLQEISDAEVDGAIKTWRECIKTSKWPSYSKRVHWATPTTWQMKEHEQRLLEAA